MAGRTVLVTGATDGIGRETALRLARSGARVLVHGRTEARARSAAAALGRAVPGASVEPVWADLSRQREVRALADDLAARLPRLHVLLHNAGVYLNERTVTEDGLETTFAVNHLAPFLLTELLRPLVVASAPARVVVVSSGVHQSGQLDFGNLQGEKQYDGYDAYARSKLANVLHTLELAVSLEGTGVTANCLHPGVIATKLLRVGFGSGGAPVSEGARTPVLLASEPALAGVTGRYFIAGRESRPAPAAFDATLRRRLWEVSEELTGLARRTVPRRP